MAKKRLSANKPRAAAPKAAAQPAKSPKPAAAHVLIRVRSENGLTLNAHAQVLSEHGVALLGKVGKPLGFDLQAALNEQIRAGVPTYLFLATREGWNGPYVTDRCRLRRIHTSLPESKRHLIPAYYASAAPQIPTWFEIADIQRLSRDEMNRIFVLSSGRDIMSVIRSSATVFKVGVRATRA